MLFVTDQIMDNCKHQFFFKSRTSKKYAENKSKFDQIKGLIIVQVTSGSYICGPPSHKKSLIAPFHSKFAV